MSLLCFYGHEVILTAGLKEEIHKVMMYPSSRSDYIEGDNTLGDVSVSHLAMQKLNKITRVTFQLNCK